MRIMDTEAFAAKYAEWFGRAKPLLEQSNWKDAFAAGFPTPVNGEAPWAVPAKPLAESTLALFSTAGLYLPGEQVPFDAHNIEGDWTFRELPRDVDTARLKIAHTHYNHASARQDINSVFPLQRLKELQADGVIGALAERVFVTSGYCTRLDQVVRETAPRIVARLQELRVDAVLHIPV
jgi:D-proline reductase (dithiol) PrdB